jgi:hypothetical protein
MPIRWVLIRDPLGKFPTQALLCTELTASPEQILTWFVQRWQLEVTYHALRAHSGMGTSDSGRRTPFVRTGVDGSGRCAPGRAGGAG